MKKIAFALVAFLVLGAAASAVPARRGFVEYTQPDGTVISLMKHGDEFGHWLTDAFGTLVEKDSRGYWTPVTEGSRLSAVKFAAKARRAAKSRARRASGHVAVGQKHFLVILVQFSDLSFSSATANADFEALLNEPGYSVNGGTGSARDFYYDNSHGYFEPVFDVYGPVTVSNTKAYYGGNDSEGNDKNPEQAVIDGCKALDSQIDFSRYDNDGDGEVDLVFMYYAGYGEADSSDDDSIWPHQWELSAANKSLQLDGKRVDRYACTNEVEGYGLYSGKMCGIGTACHEFGHAMGLPDFYDTDYADNGFAAAMFSFSTMDGGAYNNNGRTPPYFTVEERILLGWIDDDSLLEFASSCSVTLPSVNENIAYKTPTDQDGEYFVYECRNSQGWDKYLPAHGLIVTHIDKSSRRVSLGSGQSVTAASLWNDWEAYNSINLNGSHPCCYVVPAAAQSNLKYGYEYDSGDYYFDDSYSPKIPFPGSSTVTSYTAKSWNGVDSDITLSNIKYSGDVVSFSVSVPSEELDYAVIANPGGGIYQAGKYFSLELVQPEHNAVSSVAWFFDDEPVNGSSVLLSAGSHTVEAVFTLSSGQTGTVTLEITAK